MPDEEQPLAAEWQQWIAANLLEGASTEEIVHGLVEEGLEEARARSEVQELRRSPILAAARPFVADAKRRELILRLERERVREFDIEARTGLDADAFHRHYRAANRPVLLPDFARAWSALQRWTFSYLKETFGDAEVSAMDGREADPDYDRHQAKLSAPTTLGAFIERLEQTPKSNDFYIVARDGALRSPALQGLWDDVDIDDAFFETDVQKGSALWLGPGGTLTPLHHDQSDILFVQIRGEKRVRLIAPCEESIAEGARGLYGPAPLPAEVRVHEQTLVPGDTLFIPVGWWHEVEALSPSISLAINAFHGNRNGWYVPGSVR
ncbi:MAG: cupin-like domain-containing protein [Myxococcota bacterium]